MNSAARYRIPPFVDEETRSALRKILPVDEEAAVRAPPSTSVPKEAGVRRFNKKSGSPMQKMFSLAAGCVVAVFSYKTMLDGLSIGRELSSSSQSRQLSPISADELELHATWLANDFRENYEFAESAAGEADQQRRLQLDARMTDAVKDSWPECVAQKMTGIECKKYIDEEILSLFTGQDRVVEKVSNIKPETDAIVTQHSGITLTVTTESDVGSPNADMEDPASGAILEGGSGPGDATSGAALEDGGGAIPQGLGRDVDGRAARPERDDRTPNQIARAHRRIKARKKAARLAAAGGQGTAGTK